MYIWTSVHNGVEIWRFVIKLQCVQYNAISSGYF